MQAKRGFLLLHFLIFSKRGLERSLFFFLLVIIIIVLWLDEVPLLLLLDSILERSVGVSLSVVTDKSIPPEVVDTDGAANNVSVIGFVVVTNPGSNESPECLDSWICPKSCLLLWLSSCRELSQQQFTYQELVCSRGFLEPT